MGVGYFLFSLGALIEVLRGRRPADLWPRTNPNPQSRSSEYPGSRRSSPVSDSFFTPDFCICRGMTFLFRVIFVFVIWSGTMAPLQAADHPLTVVELYTSQGCSSCPPADAYLGELAARPDILALSFHVDYWDYIGWKDTFADPRFTARQRAFSVIFAQRYVYTPQMVVHGSYQVVGSNPDDINSAIDKAKSMPGVAVRLTENNGTFEVNLPQSSDHKNINVIAVFYDEKHETDIKTGENSGRKLANYNVVRDFSELDIWNGEARKITFKNTHSKGNRCAVLLQSALTGKIVGAAQLAGDMN